MENTLLTIKKWTILMSFLCAMTLASAQSLNVQTNVSGVDGMPAVEVNSVWHATAGANIQFVLKFIPPELTGNQRNLRIRSISSRFNGETQEKNLYDSDFFSDSIAFEFVGIPADTLQVAMFSLSYSYEQQIVDGKDSNKDAEYEEIIPDPIVVYAKGIRISETPSCLIEVSESAYSTDVRTFKIVTSGDSENWIFLWNGERGDASYIENKPLSLPKRVNTEIDVKKYAPDGTTEWFVYKDVISTYFYDEPTVTTESLADDLTFYKQLPSDGYWSVNLIGGGHTTEYWWYKNNESQLGGDSFNPKTSAKDDIVKDSVKLVIVTYADDKTELWRSGELFKEEYTIYPKAELSPDKKLTKSIYLGETVTFSPTYNGGGFPSGNEYEWSGDGNVEETSKDLTISPNSVGTYVYVLKSRNKYKNTIWENYDDQTYTLNVYKQPSSVITETINYDNDFECAQTIPEEQITSVMQHGTSTFEGSSFSVLQNDVVHFKLENSDGANEWSYRVTDNGTLLSEPYKLSNTIGTHTLVVKATNGENEMENPFCAEFKRVYVIYQIPSADRTAGYLDFYDAYEGKEVPLSVSVNGGHAQGWNCQWMKDGNKLEGQTSYTYIAVYEDVLKDEAMISSNIKADVTYLLDNKCRFKKDIDFIINVWPKPKAISDIFINDLQNDDNLFVSNSSFDGVTRNGNKLRFTVDRAEGGYGDPPVWNYEWEKNGKILNTYTTLDDWQEFFDDDISLSMSNIKEYEDIIYTLKVSNYKDNDLWADCILSKTIRVYNRPATPTRLIKKGTGASGTMIAITDGITDADLENRQYFLVFGYEDAFGKEIRSLEKQQTNPGNTRFETEFSASEVNNSNYRFFVYAKWKYDDDVEITSGKRYMDYVDEEWDGSDYTGLTRSVDDKTSSIIEVSNVFDCPSTRIYTLGGMLLKDFEHLTPGIYIIESACNGKKTTKKIVVK